MNQHPIVSPCTKFELNWLRDKEVTKKPHFRWNNAYDVTNFLVVLKCFGLYCIPTKFHCCQTPNWGVNLGGGRGGFLPSVQYRGLLDPVQNRVKSFCFITLKGALLHTSN